MSLPTGWINTIIKNINQYKSCNIQPNKFLNTEFELYSVPIFPTKKPEIILGKDIGSSKQKVAPGDLLLCKINPRINRVWFVGENSGREQIASSEWIVIRNKELNTTFLKYFFSEQSFRDLLCSEVTGVGGSLTRAQPKKVATYKLKIPPLNEQKCIAKKLDELLATVESIKTRLDNAPTIIKRFRQSILSAATSGKLTEEWRGENGVSEEWDELTVGDVSKVGTGNTPLKSNTSFYENGDIPWLTSSVTGSPYVIEADKFVTQTAIDECRLKLYDKGTLLVAMYGEGKTRGQVTELTFPASINQACAAIVIDEDKIEKAYLKMRLQENYTEIRMLAEGGNQPNLNLSKVRSITVPIPSKEEQIEIVSQVESFFALVDTLEEKIEAAKKRVDKLTQSILAKAFRGELVEQNPDDESAEKLLERIRAEQGKEQPKKTRRKK